MPCLAAFWIVSLIDGIKIDYHIKRQVFTVLFTIDWLVLKNLVYGQSETVVNKNTMVYATYNMDVKVKADAFRNGICMFVSRFKKFI